MFRPLARYAPGMLVETQWLAEHLDDPAVAIIDMRWREDGSARRMFHEGHIPGAVFIDWASDLVDADHRFAFMMAPADRFASVMAQQGIGDDTIVVAYADELGSGPFRLWLGSRLYGHEDVRVLDGGLAKWVSEDRPLSTQDPSLIPARWTQRTGAPCLASSDEVAEAVLDPGVVVLDSRPPEQFRGESVWFETGAVAADADGVARTPRGDLRAGRIPWAVNVPVATLYRADGTMKSPEELRSLFAEAGIEHRTKVITYCGVAISASGLAFGLRLAGVEDVSVYEASWEEWGRDPARPVARG
jgi:thiosulfate/3-mercaptopyruvate sulfurtransferase